MNPKRLITTVKTIPTHSPALRPYKNESTLNLINSLTVFQLCAVPPLVKHFPNFVKLAKATGTTPILNGVVKNTFFKHFCGGENLKEVVPTMAKLAESNVGSILNLAIEADLDSVNLTGEAAQMATRNMVNSLKDCIDIASHQPGSFIAVKITALSPPALLQTWSATLNQLQAAFDSLANKDGLLDLAQFKKLENTFPGLSKLNMQQLFEKNDLDKSGFLSRADVSAIFSLYSTQNCRGLVTPNAKPHKSGAPALTDADLDTADLITKEIKVLCEYAHSKQVKLMMDAEQTYFQPAIDDFVIGLCRLYNTRLTDKNDWKEPLVFNTYQMYLTSSLERLKADVLRARQKGYSFGVKLVRGAYMVSERELAMRLGYPSPIHPDIESTHAAYNAGVEFVIEQQAQYPRQNDSIKALALVVASHNNHSVDYTCGLMEKYGIPRSGGWVAFGQLMGMRDGTAYRLAGNGFKALKIVPYGPVEVAIAYLHRRAQENAAMIGAMKKDMNAIASELKFRVGLQQ